MVDGYCLLPMNVGNIGPFVSAGEGLLIIFDNGLCFNDVCLLMTMGDAGQQYSAMLSSIRTCVDYVIVQWLTHVG